MAEKMVALATQQAGFIGIESFGEEQTGLVLLGNARSHRKVESTCGSSSRSSERERGMVATTRPSGLPDGKGLLFSKVEQEG
ncbi:hypothetical protein [Thalassobacillus pellis]|uniref:hypothetical protein n=1 Tax=Thalassobacillus pellis TaxID=748008 RepID=UPI003B832133|nr:hypothetical protein [Thalassobacillus pellis]